MRTVNLDIVHTVLLVAHRDIGKHTGAYNERLVAHIVNIDTFRHADAPRHFNQATPIHDSLKIEVMANGAVESGRVGRWRHKLVARYRGGHIVVCILEQELRIGEGAA